MAAEQVYQLKITLKGVRPPVWRRVVVPPSVTLAGLHVIVQTAMGWSDSHLHVWDVGGTAYGQPDPDWDDGQVRSENVPLSTVAAEGIRLRYTYDFGDDWTHDVLVEKVRARASGEALPTCLGGRRSCPPEDVGGPWGYADFLEAYGDPKHPEHTSMREWAGPFDPAAFDADEVSADLADIGTAPPPGRTPAAQALAGLEAIAGLLDWSDEDDDAFLREMDEADREAAAEVRDQLPGMDATQPPATELAEAAVQLRRGVADGAWPYNWFRGANDWQDEKALPSEDAELWLAASASVVSPNGDPGWDPEAQSFVAAMEYLDWIEPVVAVVRQGAGADMTPEALTRHLSELDEDDEPLAEGAFDAALYLWEALGAVTPTRRLTSLGAWGLPLSLVRAWEPTDR